MVPPEVAKALIESEIAAARDTLRALGIELDPDE
jgi:hypothetical protein